MVTRRLDAEERAQLGTGCVYAWEERSQATDVTGIGIERFTEGKRWSASRVRDEFLFYYEKYFATADTGSGASRVPANPPADWDQLVKQTYSVFVETPRGRRKWHLTAYFTQSTVEQLGTVDDLDGVGNVAVPANLFSSTRIGRRRVPGDEGITHPHPGVQRVYAPFPSLVAPPAPAAIAPRPDPGPSAPPGSSSSDGSSTGSGVKMFDPYAGAGTQHPPRLRDEEPPHSASYPPPPPPLHYSYDYQPPPSHHYYHHHNSHPPPPPPPAITNSGGWEVYQLPLRSIHSPRSEYDGSSGSGSVSGSNGSAAGHSRAVSVSMSPRLFPLSSSSYDYERSAQHPTQMSSPRSASGMVAPMPDAYEPVDHSSLPPPQSPVLSVHAPASVAGDPAVTLAPLKTLMRIQPTRREPNDETVLRMIR
uniref:cAMP-independent regulatory protein pac2 n=1 Tax=Mycena chlorophos TaxID=658473 RepID=A0ABQ0KZU7_MYCCL|nr:predicted protein [Mycena chlorophos]